MHNQARRLTKESATFVIQMEKKLAMLKNAVGSNMMKRNFDEKNHHELLFGFLSKCAGTSCNLDTVKHPKDYQSSFSVYVDSSITYSIQYWSYQRNMSCFAASTVLL
ncbi:hypothetical protein DAPPUDRAFT_107391 [Daphnia pulex]|uniref:Uncharacterized protein n=1 Tax=Daphnia pulex TaxID=6669 RepID=E9GWZ0_DAPPU|nr:hypothetical protein DAPPUDRAFT_107391 [Daphnia pulex]|eukprot:EFX76029.1 hypothetical protein DAPPUDRAFT_107391 [Daphnia pulex]